KGAALEQWRGGRERLGDELRRLEHAREHEEGTVLLPAEGLSGRLSVERGEGPGGMWNDLEPTGPRGEPGEQGGGELAVDDRGGRTAEQRIHGPAVTGTQDGRPRQDVVNRDYVRHSQAGRMTEDGAGRVGQVEVHAEFGRRPRGGSVVDSELAKGKREVVDVAHDT